MSQSKTVNATELAKSTDVGDREFRPTSSLHTDRYEVTMVDAALRSGVAHHRATFEVFTRGLPKGRRYGVVAGTARVLDAITGFRFGRHEVDYLASLGVSDEGLAWLANYAFTGSVWGYPEGDVFGPWSPILTVESTFAEAVLLETVILSIFNHDCAVAAAASRIALAAAGRPTIEMGTRRADPQAAVAAARAAVIGGISTTSNLAAGDRYGLRTAGTAAHAFTMAHATEEEAFRAQIHSLGVDTTLLVDTYDIAHGIRSAVLVANEFGAAGPGRVRIDSGDLDYESRAARKLLDELGAHHTQIVVSGDLDEYRIDALVRDSAPVDAFGVGTSVVTGSGEPTASLTYKLVAIEDVDGVSHGVAKRSSGKPGHAGRKRADRIIDHDRKHVVERLSIGAPLEGSSLHVPYIVNGIVVPENVHSVDAAAAHHRTVLHQLAAFGGTDLAAGESVIVPEFVNEEHP